MMERHPAYPEDQQAWNQAYQHMPPPPGMVPPPPPEYAYRYREDQAPGWVQEGYYGQHVRSASFIYANFCLDHTSYSMSNPTPSHRINTWKRLDLLM